ncbi:hypothetical protein OZZ08_10220 [Malaciobacter mytili]|uniref:hypothetical protein n=1 Tax=Malaciobacter mytili TaxID=603050 RepID=UPI003BAFD25D
MAKQKNKTNETTSDQLDQSTKTKKYHNKGQYKSFKTATQQIPSKKQHEHKHQLEQQDQQKQKNQQKQKKKNKSNINLSFNLGGTHSPKLGFAKNWYGYNCMTAY